MRNDGRKFSDLRPVKVTKNFVIYPEGSVLIEFGNTKVLCNASIEEKVPSFLKGTGQGWITAEYSMLPRSTQSRMLRESTQGKVSGRTQEIQRLIGRALRAAADLNKLGERSIWIDCDVIQADGGTRTASITGGFIALSLAVARALEKGVLSENPIKNKIAAVSLGIVNGELLLDLNYEEDSSCEIDLNLVMDSEGKIIEIQGTGERGSFTKKELDKIVTLGWKGIQKLFKIQEKVITGASNTYSYK